MTSAVSPPEVVAISAPAVKLQRAGGFPLALMGLYLFLHGAPMSEILLRYTGLNLRPTIITGLLLGVGAVFSGQLLRFWELKVGKVWGILLVIYVLAAVFGDHRGASIPFIAEYGIRFHAIPFLICATAFSIQHVRRVLYWSSGATFVLLALCLKDGGMDETGRFFIPGTTLSNPNDLALSLLLGGTYLLLLAYGSWYSRLVALVAMLLILYFVLQTGSRANFLTGMVVLGVFIWSVPPRVKLAFAVALPVLAIAMAMLVPSPTWKRLTLIVMNPGVEINRNPDAVHEIGSQFARQQLQERAVALTLRNPLLGVGPQMFEVGVEEMIQAEEKVKSGWQAAHNVYLQIAAENGVPAFFVFVWVVFWCLRTNYRTFRASLKSPQMKPYQEVSLCLLLFAVTYSFGILFSNFLYDPALPILLGLTAATRMAFEQEKPAAALRPAGGIVR